MYSEPPLSSEVPICFSISLSVSAQKVANRYNAPEEFTFSPQHRISGFSHPSHPIVFQNEKISNMNWGLVPSWVKTKEQAEDIRKMTLNARAESLFEKPSFRDSIIKRRCIIPVTSFQEWHHNEDKSKTRYNITLKDEEIFSIAGIWAEWIGPQSGKRFHSFSIITCTANQLMAEIHNSKERMPVILPIDKENNWLSSDLSKQEIKNLLTPFCNNTMQANRDTE